MYNVLSGREAAKAVLERIEEKVSKMKTKPHLAIVLVGNDPASEIYVKKKIDRAAKVGVKTTLKRLSETATEGAVLSLVDELNNDGDVDGFIVQAPLPKQIDYNKVLEAIKPEKDVDGWTPASMGKMVSGVKTFKPATPLGVMKILEHYNVEISGKNVTVIGRSNVVGKPLALMLLEKNATVTVCHSKTKNLVEHTRNADILVVAVGKPGLVTADMVKEGAYVIDVGTTRVDDKLRGDVDFDNVIKKAHCSPVPGGVGPMTVAMLISNVVEAHEG
ncbi:bifunctional 5,10-methylenetetrahydrofolate dehydrogenase/5,10-methenyltetrahydrofolate cyclohydrolase [Candidatus Micrarchaeota archaeon]|nr:bifunctional 5,10-methylenetetrahydrofolate dehydrogenase/5,10-methenyltetrahydrofolate cyclohydrolase [Candidatus Micrarchaeota archaeon]